MSDSPCPICRHPVTMSRCWRLTCPTNGARESFKVVRPAGYEQAKSASAAKGRHAQSRHPSTWGDPPEPEFML